MVLDTSAFIAGFDPFSVREEQVVPPLVEEEVLRSTLTRMRLGMALESGRVKIFAPSKGSIVLAETCATSVGDSFFLSQTDLQVLALALEIKTRGDIPCIVTDDYSIQNVAAKVGVPFVSLATLGIRRLLSWIRYCPACHRKYPANFKSKTCSVCGTHLKRKPQRSPQNSILKNKQQKEQ
jgi:UPF0271 protein